MTTSPPIVVTWGTVQRLAYNAGFQAGWLRALDNVAALEHGRYDAVAADVRAHMEAAQRMLESVAIEAPK
jgi:hypothetical protein